MNKKLILGVLGLFVAVLFATITSVSAYHYNPTYESYSKIVLDKGYEKTIEIRSENRYGSYHSYNSYRFENHYYPAPHYQHYRANYGYGSYGYVYAPDYYKNPVYSYWNYGSRYQLPITTYSTYHYRSHW